MLCVGSSFLGSVGSLGTSGLAVVSASAHPGPSGASVVPQGALESHPPAPEHPPLLQFPAQPSAGGGGYGPKL